MKGSALTFGATALVRICALLQKRAETNDLEGVDSDVIQLQTIYVQTVQTLKEQVH